MASCENKYITLLDLSRQAKVITGETACFDGKIQAGIPFSGYPTGVDTGTTVSLGIVTQETSVFSGNTGTTVFDVSNSGSTNYDTIFSGYSGTVWSNALFSGNTSGLTLPITPLSADSQVIGPIWTLTQTGMTGDYVIGTQYTGYSITYSFSQVAVLPITAYTAYSGFCSAVQENFSAGTLDYKGPLDYISSKEDATVEGILTTKKLTVTDGASASTIGYVLTQIDSLGRAGWVFNSASASTNTFVTGGTLNGTNLDLTWNTGGSVPSIDFSSLSGSTNFANTDLTLTGNRVHDLSGYTATFKDDTDGQTQLRVENLSSGNGATSAINLRSRGAGAVTTAGSLLYGGDNFTGITSFNDGGSGLLTNALTIFTGGGSPGIRGHINIGSRRGTDAEVRIFNGGASFDFSSLGAKFTTTGFTSYQDVYIDNLPSESLLGTDANGKIIAGTGGGTFTGNTSGDCITDLYLTNLYGCSPITVHDTITYNGSIIDSATTNSFIFGTSHVLTASSLTHGVNADANVLLGGSSNRITPFQVGKHNTIIGGEGNKIGAPSRVSNSAIISSYNSIIETSALDGGNVIIGGKDLIISGGGRNVIVGGDGGVINNGVDHSVILGGQNITGTTDDTVYVPNLNIGILSAVTTGTTSIDNLGVESNGLVVKSYTTKRLEIGDWDMTATTQVNVAHGLSATEWKTMLESNVLIRNDGDTVYSPLKSLFTPSSGLINGGVSVIDSTNITLGRYTTGGFDDGAFTSTSYNRGWVTFDYIKD